MQRQSLSSTTRRCMGFPLLSVRKPIAKVATVFIAQDGGKANIAAKTIATLWYLLVLPDAQTRFNREIHRKRMPWYAPTRVFGLAMAAANIVTMPLSWALLFAGKKNASRLAAAGVLINPPTITLAMLLFTELSSSIVNKTCKLVKTTGKAISKPFVSKPQQNQTQNQNQTQSQSVASTTTASIPVKETVSTDSAPIVSDSKPATTPTNTTTTTTTSSASS